MKNEIHNKQVNCQVLKKKNSPRKFCPRRLSLSGSSINAFQMVQGSESSDLNNHKRSVDKDNFNDEGSNGDQKNSKKHVNILHALKLLFIASRWPLTIINALLGVVCQHKVADFITYRVWQQNWPIWKAIFAHILTIRDKTLKAIQPRKT